MKLTGQQRELIEDEIRSSFDIPELRKILIYKLDRDLSDIILPDNKIIAVIELVSTAIRQGWIITLLQALKSERTGDEKKDFRRVMDEALITLNNPEEQSVLPGGYKEIPLPPCDWCWWRDLSREGLEKLSQGLQQNQDKFIKRDGIKLLTNALPLHLANEIGADRGRDIVEAANIILKTAFGMESRGKLIVANFDGKVIDNDWAGVLNTADQRGPNSLVALFLTIYLLSGRLKSLADANLQLLHNKNSKKRR